jgi:hypothetical protein
MELSKFQNGDKKAIIVRKEYNYIIECYIKDKIISKEVTADYQKAEDLAEDFVLEGQTDGPSLLNENV